MARPALEVADIFRDHGPAWRDANRGHVSLGQLKVMSAIERCRTAALGGHVARCENCPHTIIGYNSCLMGKIINGELASSWAANSTHFEPLSRKLPCLLLSIKSRCPRTLLLSSPQRPLTRRHEVEDIPCPSKTL
jgi:hypothetical protein